MARRGRRKIRRLSGILWRVGESLGSPWKLIEDLEASCRRLPSSVLNGKNPFELVYGLKPKFSHLRSFGCLYFSPVSHNSDKFSAMSKKYTVFPFKMISSLQSVEENCDDTINNLNFFDKKHSDNQTSLSPNTYGRVNFAPNDEGNVFPCTRSTQASDGSEDNSTSEAERYKSRMVAKGFSHEEGFDYLETFSHVVKMATDVYMTLPPDFDNDKSKVCKLNKSLYGLTQAPMQWNAKLTNAFVDNDFVQSKFDYSLFTKKYDDVLIALLVYVDHIVITGNNLSEIEKFKLFLKSKSQIKDLEKLKYFLGIEVLDNKDGICLSQRNYCLELLHECGMLTAKHVDTSLPENTTMNHVETDDDHLLKNVENYQRLVAWKSKEQSTLSMSTVEDEYRSMASATCEVIWLSNLLGDTGVKGLLCVVLYCDNNSALQIAANLVFREKSKHFEIDVHLVREKVASGVIKTKKIHTTQQIADVLTKALDNSQHSVMYEKLGLMDTFQVEKLEGRWNPPLVLVSGDHCFLGGGKDGVEVIAGKKQGLDRKRVDLRSVCSTSGPSSWKINMHMNRQAEVFRGLKNWAREFANEHVYHGPVNDQWVDEFSKLQVNDWAAEFGRQELEKLCLEIATVEKRARAPAVTASPNPGMQSNAFQMKYPVAFAFQMPLNELHMYVLHIDIP
ncbi:ribonuclease H-like domain-containing protein [Tanacetum coccineum]